MASGGSLLARAVARWHISRANSARDRRDWVKARADYARALALTPGRFDIWVQLGHAQKESGALDAAGEAYARALSIAPNVADTHLQIGHLRKRQGHPDAAAESYAKAFQIDPSLTQVVAEFLALGRPPPKTDAERIAHLEAVIVQLEARVEILAERATVAAEFAFELSSTRSILGKAFERLASVESGLTGLKDETRALVIAATKEPTPEPAPDGVIEAEASNLNSSEENEIAAYS